MKKYILLIILLFICGCSNNTKEELSIDKSNYKDLDYEKYYSISYDINNDDEDELIVVGELYSDKYIVDIIYYNDKGKVDRVCKYKECRIDIYDNGLIYNYVINDYYSGIYIFEYLNKDKDMYYYKYETDNEYIIYDDKDLEEESKYQNTTELLNNYVKGAKIVNINKLGMKLYD